MWCDSLIITRRFAQISPSISWRKMSEIKDGLPLLCSLWTSVLPSENSRHHFRHILLIHNVTINSNNLFVNFRWTFTFALRNLMTEHTSHLAGLWIRAAISNTSHSNKAGSTTVKWARLTGKRIKVDGSVVIVSIKNFHISLRVMYHYLPDTPHTTTCNWQI
jgi:hypothetical protein